MSLFFHQQTKTMKLAYVTIAILISFYSMAQTDVKKENTQANAVEKLSQRRVNFYVVNKPKTLDLFSRLVIVRARKRGMTRRHKFIVIVAGSSKEVKDKILDYLQKKNAL